MVSKQASQRKTVVRRQSRVIFLALLMIFMATFTVIGCLVWSGLNTGEGATNETEGVAEETVDENTPKGPEIPEVTKIDLQLIVDEWVKTVGGNKSVLIYDLERGEAIGAYNAKENYSTASLYKLFVVYEGYKRVQRGEWQLAAAAGGTGRTIGQCLDLAIRESNSPCAETLWAMIGREELDRIIVEDFGIHDSQISKLTSNPEDIAKMMQIYYEHKDITDAGLIAQMQDSFLNQPITEYNWRQGLPSGFTQARVYNKVGWDWNGKSWNIYHDAAIVELPEQNRHFIVVVMTNQVPYQKITGLGTMIENTLISAEEL